MIKKMIFIILYIYLFRVYQKVALEKLRSLYPFREPSLTKRLVTPSHTGCASDSNNDQTNNSLVDNKMVINHFTLKEGPEPHLQNWIYKYLRVDNHLKHHRNCHTIAGECGKILFSFLLLKIRLQGLTGKPQNLYHNFKKITSTFFGWASWLEADKESDFSS